jgi:HlyD family secretion protein
MSAFSLPRRVCALLLGLAALSACSPVTQPPEPAAPTADLAPAASSRTPVPASAQAGLQNGVVVVDGRVVPKESFELTLPDGAVISEVLVDEGDAVAAGQPLVQLDVRAIELQIREAETNVAEARAAYELLVAEASPEQLAQAAARIEQARAGLSQVRGRVTPDDIAAARAELEAARATLAELRAGPEADDVAIAQTEVERTQAVLANVRDEASTTKSQAEAKLERLANGVRDTQAYYQHVYWQNRQRHGEDLPPEAAGIEEAALRAVQNSELLLHEARLEYEQAQKEEVNRIAVAEADVARAEARLRQVFIGPEASQLAEAQQRISAANARLSQLTGDATLGNVARAEAELNEAEAAYGALLADPTTPELALAEARLMRAEVQLEEEKLRLEKGSLSAPFDGVVARVLVKPGDILTENQLALVIGDFSSWLIETESLNELSVVHVREGDKALITFYALPGFEIPGTVTYITTIGSTERPSDLTTNYRLMVTPDTWDERLRWNMTATVAISPQN